MAAYKGLQVVETLLNRVKVRGVRWQESEHYPCSITGPLYIKLVGVMDGGVVKYYY